MYFAVIRLKYAIFICIMIFVCLVGFGIAGKTIPTFKVSDKEIPIYSVKRNDNKVALTFDCAWGYEDMPYILDTLDKYNAKATFFVLGDWVNNNPDVLKKIYQRGHEIGTHSMSHTDYTTLSSDEIMADIIECEDTVSNVIDDRPILVRAPSGAYNNNVIKTCEDNGRIYIQWSVDGLDYPDTATEESIYTRVTQSTKSGDIILLHNGTKYTSRILPKILDTLTRDYEFVKVSDLIYKDNFKIDVQGRQIQTK